MFGLSIKTIASTILVVLVVFTLGVIVGGNGMLAKQFNNYGFTALAAGVTPSVQPAGVDFAPVWKSWRLLEDRFVDAYATTTSTTTQERDLDQERVWGLISGLAESMGDPYTVFLPPSEAEIFHDDISGSFEGVGMEIATRDRILTVVSPLKGTPAYRAGIKSGDKIIGIDGQDTKNIGVNEAVKIIRGEKGTDVIFTIIREGELEILSISVTRDTIEIPTINTVRRADGIFIIELSNFSAKSADLFRLSLKEFAETNYRKLIIDLRGNPGGYLNAAVDMASWFLPSGKIVVTEDYRDQEENRVHRSRGYDAFNDSLELVILIDRGSASASEILAGALQAHGRATLIGTRSFGKGSVQELIDITPETSLKITIARWLLAGDIFITKEGIDPDVLVEFPDKEDINPDRDYILEEAVQFLHTQ